MSLHRHGSVGELRVRRSTPGIHLICLRSFILILITACMLRLILLNHIRFDLALFAIDAGKVWGGASWPLGGLVVGLLIVSNVIIIIAIFNVFEDLERVFHYEEALIQVLSTCEAAVELSQNRWIHFSEPFVLH